MAGNVRSLAEYRCDLRLRSVTRRIKARHARPSLPLVIQQVDDTVNIIMGNREDGVELWVEPELADEIAEELRRVAQAARSRPKPF